MKKIKIFLCLLILSLCVNVNDVFASTRVNTRSEGNYLVPADVIITESNKQSVLATPAVDASEKIYDFADLLTDGEEKVLFKHVKHFIDSTQIDYVIVTISKNNKASSMNYARDFYNFNDFSGDGIILLIDRDNKGIYMTTNGRAVELFPDSRMEPILKNVFNLTKEKKFYDACKSFTTSISEFVQIGVVPDGEEIVKVGKDGKVKTSKNYHYVAIAGFALAGTFIIMLVLIISSKIKKKRSIVTKDCLNKETMRIINISEMSLGSRTYKSLIGSSEDKKDKPNKGKTGTK